MTRRDRRAERIEARREGRYEEWLAAEAEHRRELNRRYRERRDPGYLDAMRRYREREAAWVVIGEVRAERKRQIARLLDEHFGSEQA